MSPPEMNLLFNHINSFSELLNKKGYDSNFYCPYGFSDPIKDSVTKHVFYSFQDTGKLDSITLITDTDRKSSDSPYVRCSFETDYTMKEGFKVANMTVELRNGYGALKHNEVLLIDNTQIPDKVETNKMMLEQNRSRRI